ncbi:26S proteasome complex subunit SEM1 [Podochytrium sp. JEL0797]|nr:26S proteasome complex subunit SEM1 [Podochytrium sp. JEL0797]
MSANNTQQATIPQLNALEEDDEFEDFGAESWDPNQGNADDKTLWLQDWDDENTPDDDFTRQLRAELSKTSAAEKKDESSMQQ